MTKKRKILIVDDEPALAEMLKEYFTRKKYEVETAFNGEEGLIKAKKFIPDIILLDIVMPVLDGVAMLKYLKKNPVLADIPVVMLTNLDSQEKTAETMEAGSCGYLLKLNNSPDDLDKKITEILDSR